MIASLTPFYARICQFCAARNVENARMTGPQLKQTCQQVPHMCGCSLVRVLSCLRAAAQSYTEVRALMQSYTSRMERSILCDYSQIQTNCIAPFFLQSELLG